MKVHAFVHLLNLSTWLKNEFLEFILQGEIYNIKSIPQALNILCIKFGKFIMKNMTLTPILFLNVVFISFPAYTKERKIISLNE